LEDVFEVLNMLWVNKLEDVIVGSEKIAGSQEWIMSGMLKYQKNKG